MAIRNIRQEGDEILKKKSREVEVIDEKTKELINDMIETMHKYDGVGLAAVQVGILKRIIVIDIYDDNRVIINRFGKIHTKMVYILNEETLATLKTDFGYEVSMSNYTQELRIESNLLAITYQTLSDKEQGSHHKLLITWKK